jgi:hypothetical protein
LIYGLNLGYAFAVPKFDVGIKNDLTWIPKNSVAAALVIVPEDNLERLVLYRSKKLQKLLESRTPIFAQGKRLGFEEFWAEIEKTPNNV